MTKEQILQKHFTAEFGHDGHGKFMQYILNAMEEYAEQQVKNLNKPAVRHIVCPTCGCNKLQHEGDNHYLCLSVKCNFQGQIMP